MYSLVVNVYDVICTYLMSYPGITFVVTQGDAEHGALHFAHPSAMRILISGNRSPACVAVLPSYTYLATFSMMFPSTATVDVMAGSC